MSIKLCFYATAIELQFEKILGLIPIFLLLVKLDIAHAYILNTYNPKDITKPSCNIC